jgi:hypothetical protein
MPDLPLTGGCMCGAVRYEIDEPLIGAAYCHCTRCQRRTGGASAITAAVEPGSLRIVSGEGKVRSWEPPDGGFGKAFCSDCGSALFGHRPGESFSLVRLGTFDGDPGARPSYHQFADYAAVWEPIPDDGLPRHAEKGPF